MSQSPLWWRTLVLSTIVLCIVAGLRASGQDKKPGSFASVDLAKIQADYKDRANMESDLQALQQKLERRLQRRNDMPLLIEAEQATLDQLSEKDANDADKKKIKELTDKGNLLGTEIQALRQKPDKDLTEGDKTRLKNAEQDYINAKGTFTALQQAQQTELQAAAREKSEKLVKAVRESIKKVAEQKGLTIVFSTEFVPYAGVDITLPVISILNK